MWLLKALLQCKTMQMSVMSICRHAMSAAVTSVSHLSAPTPTAQLPLIRRSSDDDDDENIR